MLKQFSNSSVALFDRCPLAFSFQYLDKISVVTAPALNRGSNLHQLLERYGTTSDAAHNPDNSMAASQQSDVIESFLASEVGQEVKCVLTSGKCLRETRLGCTPDLTPDTFGHGFFRGIIDLCYIGNDGIWTIIDYKSGKYRPDQSFDQLKIYGALLTLHFPTLVSSLNSAATQLLEEEEGADPVASQPLEQDSVDVPSVLRLKYKFLDAQKELGSVVSREECLDLLRDKISAAKEILVQVKFPKKTGQHCRWCSYRDFCRLQK